MTHYKVAATSKMVVTQGQSTRSGALPEQKKRLLKAKIAVALHDELGRVPKEEEINQVGPCPHLGNHLRVFKCEMIDVLLGKLSGCLTPNARMIPLRVVIRNRPAD